MHVLELELGFPKYSVNKEMRQDNYKEILLWLISAMIQGYEHEALG